MKKIKMLVIPSWYPNEKDPLWGNYFIKQAEALNDYIDVHVKRLLENNSLESLKKNQVIQGFYELHKEVGIPKRKNLPASENLLKNLLKKQ